MKTRILLLLICISAGAFGQVVNEQVQFDDPNDQSNYFYGMQSLVQIQTNGVTGGCLQVADTNFWGNDNYRYCSKYMGQDGMTYTTKLMVYYNIFDDRFYYHS